MKVKLTGRKLLLASGLLFVWLFTMYSPGYSQPTDQEGADQSETSAPESYLLAGLNFIPDDVRERWLGLVNSPESQPYNEFMLEGEHIIRSLGELSEITGGEVPDEEESGGDTYLSLNEQLLSVINLVETKISDEKSDQPASESTEPETEDVDQTAEETEQPEEVAEKPVETEEDIDDADIPVSDPVEQVAEPGIEEIEAMLQDRSTERNEVSEEIKNYRRDLIKKGLKILQEQTANPENRTDPARRDAIAGLYFRFTELTYQESYDLFLEETGNYIDEMNRLSESNPSAASRLVPPEPDYSRVMAMYQKVVDEYPTSEYADDALYNIGVLTSESPSEIDRTNANRIFETLISIYPESNYVLNSLRRIGDYYFQPPINDLESAALAFNQILQQFQDSKYYQEALYKLGWTYYRMSDLPQAVEYFASVLDISYAGDEGGLDAGTLLDIANESINYLGICYAIDPVEWDGAGVDNLAIWLENNPVRKDKYGADVVLQLGDIYNIQLGRYMKAAETYYKFLEVFPLDDRAPEVQAKIVDLYQEGNIFDIERAQIEKINFFTSYNPDSQWWKKNENPATRKKVIPLLEKTLDMIIDELLVQATDAGDRNKYIEYEKYSREYLRFWPKGPNAYKILYKLASVLENKLRQPMLAMREYWQVANEYDDSTYREIAAGRVVAIAQKFNKQEESGRIYVSDDGEILPPLDSTS
ncbi:MAG: tetratricopeptide repeat protein, partial [Calditrichaeota bacterium]|nr:tetratricopeptide repeat protein [Calditrichota bacterium]